MLVSHDLPVVAQTRGRAAVMYAGEIAVAMDRCAVERCAVERPALRPVGTGHEAACHHTEDHRAERVSST